MVGMVALTLVVGCRSGDDAGDAGKAASGGSAAEDDRLETVDLADVLGPVDAEQTVQDPVEMERMARAEYVSRLQVAVKEGELSQAIEILQEARQRFPQDADFAVSLLSVRLQRDDALAAGDPAVAAESFLQTAELAREVLGQQVELADRFRHLQLGALFNEARARAQQGDVEAAMAALDQVFRAGFQQYTLVREDPFFESLQNEPAFQEFVNDHAQRIQTQLRQEAQQAMAEHEPFDFDFELPDLDAQPVKLADFQGKLVIVDVWGTWCPPCRREIPHFIKLRNTYAEDLEIVGINYEQGTADEVVQQIRDFVAESAINYVCLVGDADTQQQIPDFQGFPTTLLIDREGKVRVKLVGYHPYEQLDAYIAELMAAGRPES